VRPSKMLGAYQASIRRMERKQAATAFFLLALAVISLYFCYLIARPFLGAIFFAVMLAIVFHPVHVHIQARIRRPNAAALLSTILVLVILIVPAVGLGIVISKETRGLHQLLNERSAEQGGWNQYLTHVLERPLSWLGRYVDLSHFDLRAAILRRQEQISQYLLSSGAQAVSNFVSFFVNAVAAFFTLFFLFRDGGLMKEHAAVVLPLTREQVERLFTGISNSIVANVYGVFAVGVAQGSLTGLAFWALGLPSPVFWGMITALFSTVPIIGSSAVWGPAVVVLAAGGHWWKALILLAWGAAVVGQSDNFIRPWVISKRAQLNTLLVFFALLGGVEAFGVMGLFIGPVVLSFTHVVLEMLRETNLDQPTPGGRSSGDFHLADRRKTTRRAATSGTER
jgi:predicted PurR-regulated permease PerM